MIELKNVCQKFGNRTVLRNINLKIESGETIALIGGSGSGKSTLLRLMIGLTQPTSGEIWIDDEEISRYDEMQMNEVRKKMGMVFQYSALFDSMSVGENVAFGLREHSKFSEEKIQAIVKEMLELVGLFDVQNLMPNELSGGMKKRVSLARALAYRPTILFYDEPDSGLDPVTTEKIGKLILSTQEKFHVTSIVVTHDMETACMVANRIAMLYDGELIAVEPVEKFRRLDDERVKNFLRGLHIKNN